MQRKTNRPFITFENRNDYSMVGRDWYGSHCGKMMMIMIVVLLQITNPGILCGSHLLLYYFRTQVVITLETQKHEGKKPTVLTKVLMCGFETLRLNPSWHLLLSQLLVTDNAVISSALSVNQRGDFSRSF